MGFYQSQDPNVLGLFGQGVGQSIQQGAQRRQEQDILSGIIEKTKQGGDILQEILGSALSPEAKQNYIQSIGQFEERRGKTASNLMDAQNKQMADQQKLMKEEGERRGLISQIKETYGAEAPEGLENLSMQDLRETRKQLQEVRFKNPAYQQASDTAKAVLGKADNAAAEIQRGEQIMDLSQKPGTSFDSMYGFLRNTLGDFPVIGKFFPVGLNEAQLQSSVLQGIDELKKGFGARVTDFDFENWLKGQPSINKTAASNYALGVMVKNSGRLNEELAETMNDYLEQFPDDPRKATKLYKKAEEAIRSKWSELTRQDIDRYSPPKAQGRGVGQQPKLTEEQVSVDTFLFE
jgi:hypothetical protein